MFTYILSLLGGKKSCVSRTLIIFISFFIGSSQIVADVQNNSTKAQALKILNWSEYLDPEVISDFEKKYQVEVKEFYYESDEDRTKQLALTDGVGYDIIVSDMPSIRLYARRGWLETITPEKISSYRYLSPRYLQSENLTGQYAVPLLWGTLGIAYRKDLVKQPITSWQQLFQPADELKYKIVLIRDVNDLVGMGLKSLGYSANSTIVEQLDEVETLLLAQKPYVKSYIYISVEENSALLKGDVWAAMAYNGDALLLNELNPDIEFVVPREGGNLWVDYFLILKASKNKDMAYKFLDFVNQPEIAKRIAEYASCATPNVGADKLLPSEFRNDPLIYPPKDVMDKMEIYNKLPARVTKKRNGIVTKIYN